MSAPRYRMLPTETDLNTPPLLPNFPDKVLPIGAVHSKPTGGGTYNLFYYFFSFSFLCFSISYGIVSVRYYGIGAIIIIP